MTIGLKTLSIRDDVQDADVAVHLLYPAEAKGEVARLPYPMEVARDAPPVGEGLRPIVISHGGRGTPWVYRDLISHLVKAGFAVIALEHPGDRLRDDALYGKEKTLQNRPRHVKLGIDAAFDDALLGSCLSERGVGMFGQSMGGYTALAIAGGNPGVDEAHSNDGTRKLIDVVHDPRVRALVLHAPTAFWFAYEGALRSVDLPILLLEPEKEEILPPGHAQIIAGGVNDASKVDHRIVKDAGHFAALTPFPASMNRSNFPPAHDPEGFDRAAYQVQMNADITAFFDAWLT